MDTETRTKCTGGIGMGSATTLLLACATARSGGRRPGPSHPV